MRNLSVLLRPRHLIVSLIVLALVSGVVLSTQATPAEAPEEPRIAPFRTVAPGAGDAIRFVGEWPGDYLVSDPWTFHNGTHRITAVTFAQENAQMFSPGAVVDAHGWQPVGYRSSHLFDVTVPGFWGLPTNTDTRYTDDIEFIRPGRAHQLHCGLLHPFQGQLRTLEADIPGPECERWRMIEWRAVAERTDDGPRQVLFELIDRNHVDGYVVLQEDVPYAIEIRDAQHRIVATLAGYTPGQPIQAPAAVPTPLPIGQQRPLTLWGPDVTGVNMPVTAKTAYDMAIADEGQALADYIDARPDAYLRSAWGGTWHMDTEDQHWWSLIYSDGNDQLRVNVGRTIPRDPQPGVIAPVRDRVDSDPVEPVFGLPMPASMVPATAPSIASLIAAQDAYGGAAPDAYGYSLGCDTTACDAPLMQVEIGRSSGTGGATTTLGVTTQEYVQDFVLFNGDGDFDGITRRASTTDNLWVEPQDPPAGNEQASSLQPFTQRATLQPASFALAASAGALAAVLYFLHPAIKTLSVAMFSRVRTDRMLRNPHRERIHDVVRDEPGIHFQQLRRQVGMANGTLTHHLQKLEAAGIVTAAKTRGHTCYFLRGSTDRRAMAAAPVLKSDGAQGIQALIEAEPGLGTQDLARRLGMSVGTVHFHLKRMEAAGIVTATKAGRSLAWAAA